MQLKHKVFIITSFVWIAFLSITSLDAIRYPFDIYFSLAVITCLVTLLILEIYSNNSKAEHQQLTKKFNEQLLEEVKERRTLENKLQSSAQEALVELAHYDALTSLPNRVFFNETLNKSMSHAKRHKKNLALLQLNIDRFNAINNTYGESLGNKVIKELASRFVTTLRSEDVLAHLDGDEFIILLNDIGKPKFASAVAEKLLAVCKEPFKIDGHEIFLSVSIGICIYPNDGDSLEDLLTNVDKALHKAKRLTNKKYQFYAVDMDAEAHEYIKLETALRKAIENNELVIYYQPKLHIKKGNIAGVESLIRWMHPDYGLINPTKFLPIAEETGLIMKIGEWALREACKTNKRWQDEGYEHFSMAVNLSSKQFHNPNIDQLIADVLAETGLNPKYLEIEITENTVMEDVDYAAKILEKIKKTGVQLSIDHFGTGYTSISHLKRFPVNIIKIDQNFIKGVPNNPDDSAITSAIIALAHNLAFEVVAEGVETAEQVQFLADHNCDMVQGYFLSHPLPEKMIVSQFKKLIDEVLM